MASEQDRDQLDAERLAAKINHLFEVVRPAGRERPYSSDEVAAHLARTAEEGPTISANYLRALRRAARTNPTVNSLRAIARFFEIEPGFLLNDDERTQEIWNQLEKLKILADIKVHGIAARAARLDDSDRDWLLSILDSVSARRGAANSVDDGALDEGS